MKKFVAYFLFVLCILSCSVNDDNAQEYLYELLPVESTTLPDQFYLGETYEITLTYIRPSTCYSFSNIYYLKEANERTIAVVAYVVVGNDSCVTLDEETETTFDFKVTETGSYIFKFWQGEDNYMVVEVPVVD